MKTDDGAPRLRRYLLGAASQEEYDAIERDYFAGTDALDAVRAAEDEMVEEYLSGRLSDGDRERFERHYLSTPAHRNRVAVLAALRQTGDAGSQKRDERASWWTVPLAAVRGWSPTARLALAAALLVLIAAGVWTLAPDSRGPSTSVVRAPSADPSATPQPGAPVPSSPGAPSAPPETASPPRAPRTVLAVSLAPVLVRGAAEPASLAIATGTDIVRLELQGEAGVPSLRRARAIVTTVSGEEVWRSPAIEPGESSSAAIARVDVPAARLRPDDYIVTLFAADAEGREVEQYRYFLRVRRQP